MQYVRTAPVSGSVILAVGDAKGESYGCGFVLSTKLLRKIKENAPLRMRIWPKNSSRP
jgi:hypothetical protein